jgi:hypothetical protein
MAEAFDVVREASRGALPPRIKQTKRQHSWKKVYISRFKRLLISEFKGCLHTLKIFLGGIKNISFVGACKCAINMKLDYVGAFYKRMIEYRI